jgi:hypothetical protein
MSVLSASGLLTRTQADEYSNALLSLLGDQDPLRILSETPDVLRAEVDAFPADRIRTPEAPGKWSAAIVLAHLADAELVTGFRLRLILAQERPPLTPYDQDLWATELHYERATPAESLERFTVLRRANLLLWAHATPEELARAGQHAERGDESVDRQRRLMAGHDLAHRRQLVRIRTSVTGRDAG